MIKIEKVNKYYNRHRKNELHVINNVSINLENSGLVALLGPSGSGKTTILNAIGGLDKVKSGKIYIDNKKVTSKRASKRDKIRNLNIGYIFQDYKLIENMSVYDNIALVLKMIGIKDKEEIKTRVNYVLEKVGMYRYRNRPAEMLSGGEKQRVGIARAIVKAPNIIIADEPTGNLDSKNSLEIMKIIKSISKEKLVILVTHENDLAKFYATRVIKIKDGFIQKDYANEHSNELDYQIENKFYLKDFKNKENIKKDNVDIKIFSDKKENINIDIVIKNGNIYIKTNTAEKLEIVDDDSNVEFIDDNYKKISKDEIEKYKFNFEDVINKNIKKRYTSIYNPINMIVNGFINVFNFSILKKILLLGFLASSMFIMYAISTIFATLNVEDKDFIKYNSNYLIASLLNVKVSDFLQYEQDENVNYILPGDSIVNFNIKYDDFYQTSKLIDNINGSISSSDLIDESKLIYGKMPENSYEIVVDKLTLNNVLNNESQYAKMAGITTIERFLEKEVYLPNQTYIKPFKIVGIVEAQSPSIYANKDIITNIIAICGDTNSRLYGGMTMMGMPAESSEQVEQIYEYSLFADKIELKKGKMPENDYEVIVNISKKDEMKLNKEIKTLVNDTKLKVVGYYDSMNDISYYLVNNNTAKYKLITEKEGFTVYAKDKQKALSDFRSLNLNIKDSYNSSKDEYMKEKQEQIKNNIIVSGIILVISLVEIFLMIRSSFLSRIKEIGILRAIGVKKKDIYKMFAGEILAITTITSIPGIILMSYILKTLSTIKYLERLFIVNGLTILLAIVFVYSFNLLVGLLPVHKVVKKTPAQILSRHDLQ